jgi:hypothetical protein
MTVGKALRVPTPADPTVFHSNHFAHNTYNSDTDRASPASWRKHHTLIWQHNTNLVRSSPDGQSTFRSRQEWPLVSTAANSV